MPNPSALQHSNLRVKGISFFPAIAGNMQYCGGLALRNVSGILRAYVWSYATRKIIEFIVPPSFTGQLQFSKVVGSLTTAGNSVYNVRGLTWDELGSRLYQSFGPEYNGTSLQHTISMGNFDSSGNLVQNGTSMNFGSRWKKCQGNTIIIPSWFANSYLSGKRLGQGVGGYYSLVSQPTNTASMGPSLTAFNPPADGSSGVTLPNTPLQGYNYPSAGSAPTVQHRPTNYHQEFDSRYPYDPTLLGIGYWTWADQTNGAGCWIDNGIVSGFVTFTTLGIDCTWYPTPNPTPPPEFLTPVCSGYVGTKAAINSKKKGIYSFITSPTDLALVAAGANENSIQASYAALDLTSVGIQNPSIPGYPDDAYSTRSAAWEPISGTWGLLIRNIGSSHLSAVVWGDLGSTPPPPPPPDPIPSPIIFYPVNGATGVTP